MSSITLSELGKVYPGNTRALDGLSLDIADGDFMVFVGPSGCGKTTALRMVAGLETITEGEIRVGDRVVNDVEPRKRDLAMVFQNYALYPHMTVFDNIAFPLQCAGVSKTAVKTRVVEAASLLGLGDLLGRKPRALSGGQRQRVAMGRAIVRKPQAFLMDEPLSNLDAKLRMQMRSELSNLQRELKVTTIYVTHDQVEAMTMGSMVAVMRSGVLQQAGAPEAVYDRPANLFVATFIGSPGMNLLRGHVERRDDGLKCSTAAGEFTVAAGMEHALEPHVGAELVVGIRPEKLARPGSEADESVLIGEVSAVEMLGHERLVRMTVPGQPVLTDDVVEARSEDESNSDVAAMQSPLDSGSSTPLYMRFPTNEIVRPGERLRVPVDPQDLHFFSLPDGVAIA